MESEKSKAVIGVVRASRPLFRSRHDRLAFAVHATFLASGYSLAATGPAAYAADALSSSSTGESSIVLLHARARMILLSEGFRSVFL